MAAARVLAPALRAAILVRISKDDEKDGLGVERQRKALLRRARSEGWVPVEYDENDTSASRYRRKKRLVFEQMINDAKAGLIDVVLVAELSRYTREPRVIEDLIDAADAGTFDLVSLEGGKYNPQTTEGRLRLRNEAAFAAAYSDFVSGKVRLKKAELRERGVGPGGSRAFGYLGADRKTERRAGMVIDKREAKAYALAIDDVLSGTSLAEIARRWNAQGFRTPRTRSSWGVPSVRATLTNPRHAGLLARSVKRDGRKVYDVIGPAKWPAIITKSKHDRISRLLLDSSRRRNHPPRRGLLTGLLICGRCGGPLRSNGTYYLCRPVPETNPPPCGRCSARTDAVNALVEELLIRRLTTPTILKAMTRPAKAKRKGKGEDADELQRELDELAAQAGSGELPMREYLVVRKGVEKRLLEALKAAGEPKVPSPEATALVASPDVSKAWRALSRDQCHEILMQIVECITITPSEFPARVLDPRRLRVEWRR